jgi:transposase InsO family protein
MFTCQGHRSTREMEPRRQAASAPAGHTSFRRPPLPTGECPRCVHPHPAPPGPPPPQSSPCHRVVAEVLAVFTDHSSEFTSAVCVAVCDRAGAAAFHRPTGSCLDNAVAESFFATLKASSSTASSTAPAPKREPRSSAAVGARVTELCRGPWDRRRWRIVTNPSAVRPPTLETACAR